MHRVHHVAEHRVDDAFGFLGVAISEQLHRALHVREQHRDMLALAFQ
jgi:hypothetical protein